MPFHQVSQQHDLTIRKFQRIVMGVRAVYIDLPERSRFCVPRIVSFTGPTERLFKNVNFNRLLSPHPAAVGNVGRRSPSHSRKSVTVTAKTDSFIGAN